MAYHDPAMDVTDAILKRMGVDPKVRQEDKDKEKAEKPAAADGK